MRQSKEPIILSHSFISFAFTVCDKKFFSEHNKNMIEIRWKHTTENEKEKNGQGFALDEHDFELKEIFNFHSCQSK